MDGIDHKGCISFPLKIFEQFLVDKHTSEFIILNDKLLAKNNVESLYIYNKKYCNPIGIVLGANLFVMTNIKMIKMNSSKCSDITYDIEMKVYSSVTQKEKILLRFQNITIEEFQKKIGPEMEELFKQIISLNKA